MTNFAQTAYIAPMANITPKANFVPVANIAPKAKMPIPLKTLGSLIIMTL